MKHSGTPYDQLPPKVQAMVDAADGKPAQEAKAPQYANEPELHAACERWLKLVGFKPRTPTEIQRHHAGLWYIHINKAKANPIIADLLLIDSTRGPYQVHALEVELKCENTNRRLSVEQHCHAQRNEIVVVWTLEQFQEAVRLWQWAGRRRDDA